MHPDQVDLVITQSRPQFPIAGADGNQASDNQRALHAGCKHETEVAKQLAPAGEVQEIMLHGNGLPCSR
ncbi:IncW plasmid conjugative protein TrwB [Altererythrobacter epoxidivorans]|uniref:IncW plasmid conjugative protein TrwB n=1 Tax=Altererythrobacter epoxidivorans TaxID=361183 RepID=A0A0M4LS88_9SPHN|nr:IncW plasmid conjugative protein TrwB [Altererythrobacter epoxidivorans]